MKKLRLLYYFFLFIFWSLIAESTPSFAISPDPQHNSIQHLSWTSKRTIIGDWQLKRMKPIETAEKDLTVTVKKDSQLKLRKNIIIPAGSTIRLKMAVNNGSFAQLFWGFTFDEYHSLKTPIIADGKLHEYSFKAPYDLLGKIRLDPTNSNSRLRIASIEIPTAPQKNIFLRSIYWDHNQLMSGRWEKLNIVLENQRNMSSKVLVKISIPNNLEIQGVKQQLIKLGYPEKKIKSRPKPGNYNVVETSWFIRSQHPRKTTFDITIQYDGERPTRLTQYAHFVANKYSVVQPIESTPPPQPTDTNYLIGAHYFPGWKEGVHFGWSKIAPFPDRKPLLGWYDEGNPDVADWEIKWALEHGISFFIYNWFRERNNEGKIVRTRLNHALHDGFFNARFKSEFRFCLMFANQYGTNISNSNDLINHLLPFWIEHYFKHPNYLLIDNKPVLLIHQWDKFKKPLGKTQIEIAAAIARARALVKSNGFDGIWLFANTRPVKHDLSPSPAYDYSFSWLSPNDHLGAINTRFRHIPVVSAGWNSEPWGGRKDGIRYPPHQFKTLLAKTKKQMDQLPDEHLGKRLLIIDHWNEWGEGHYIAPHREYKFEYLDAIRDVFSTNAPTKHVDLAPEDIGLGPYDFRYRKMNQLQVLSHP